MLWVDPRAIRFKISPHDDLRGERGGDWDIERRFPLDELPKHKAIWERYRDGRRWEDTDLFREIYARRFAEGDHVRGEPSLEALAAQYYSRVDGMFADMQRKGFRTDCPLPTFLIGRGGEVFIGNQGNHRLAMAQVLGLDRIAGNVICRHRLFKLSA